MAVATRSTPSFALPATQNTAPVHEFRCLYTHDVRKKAKKWHDGSARFHTFNRRVMVYDDTSNYIGDLHYRADDDFGEGIELQLDRGVLVEIGERVGETQTDLTGIVNKPRADASSPTASMAARSRPIQRINVLNGQGRPKSLSEMLGTSQSRLGRATLPVTSPFEQRQTLSDTQQIENPYKRQKIGLDKENVRPEKPTVRQLPPIRNIQSPPQMTISSTSSPSAKITHTVGLKTTNRRKPERRTIDISSDEETVPMSSVSPNDIRKAQRTVPSSPVRPVLIEEPISVVKDRLSKQRKSDRTTVPPQASVQQSDILSKLLPTLASSSNKSDSATRLGMSSLKMRSQKPRRKLMYKALLPVKADSRNIVSSVENHQDDEPQGNLMPVQQAVNDSRIVNENLFQFDEQEDNVSAEVAASPTTETPKDPQNRAITDGIQTQTSPLFVSQTRSQRSPTPTRMFVEDDFVIPTTQQTPLSRTANTDSVSCLDPSFEDDDVDLSQPESPCFPQPPPRLNATTTTGTAVSSPSNQHIDEHIRTSHTQRTPSHKETQPIARSLSTNDRNLFQGLPTIPPLLAASPPVERAHPIPYPPPPPAARQQLPPSPPTHPPHSSNTKQPLQRNQLDTAAIVPTTIGSPAAPSTTNEEGPWTNLEAFLLFEKWPACKQKTKPVFEPISAEAARDEDHDEMNDFSRTGFGAVGGIVPRLRIRSARSFLRDG